VPERSGDDGGAVNSRLQRWFGPCGSLIGARVPITRWD
jgi:hypothetical protein